MTQQTEYKVGQAVLVTSLDSREVESFSLEMKYGGLFFIAFIDGIDGHLFSIQDFNGIQGKVTAKFMGRPATELEIIKEGEKEGWGLANKKDIFSPKKYHHIKKAPSEKWYTHARIEIDNNNIKDYCLEGLLVHKLITALNLC